MIKFPLLTNKKFILPLILLISTVFVGGIYLFYEGLRVEYPRSESLPRPLPPSRDFDFCKDGGRLEYFTYDTVDPEDFQNNKFGLYIYAEVSAFMDLAEELVNSNGGEWGYVLIPYNVKDYDRGKWGRVFRDLRNKNLIPIIQLYDLDVSDYEKQTRRAASFLDSFVWPIRQRYISVYNEPNDSRFWKGYTDPVEYAEILDFTIDTFKDTSPHFFMLNGALNVSATSGFGYIDAFDFMIQMDEAVPGIFDKLDGWASHSYPQPNFSGSPHSTGRNSIRAYEAELEFLSTRLNVSKDLPVFITETGWAHAEGKNYNRSFPTAEKVSEYMVIAYEQYWLPDDRVLAVTPFTIWYEPPYDHFSWIDSEGKPYPHFEAVREMEKTAGTPDELILREIQIGDCE